MAKYKYFCTTIRGKTFVVGLCTPSETYDGFTVVESDQWLENRYLTKAFGYHDFFRWQVKNGQIVDERQKFDQDEVDDRNVRRIELKIMDKLPKLMAQFAEDGDMEKVKLKIKALKKQVKEKYAHEVEE